MQAIWRRLLLSVIRNTNGYSEEKPEESEESKRDDQENLPERKSNGLPISNMSRNSISNVSTESKKDVKDVKDVKEIVKKLFRHDEEECNTDSINDDDKEPTGTYYTYNVEDYRVIREDYRSINSLVSTLRKRPNNMVMKGTYSSKGADYSFTGTESYREAERILLEGWSGLLNLIKPKYDKKVDILSHKYVRKKSSNIDSIVGGTPNIPRALMCLPNNLIHREPSVKKINAVEIVYNVSMDCTIKTDNVIKSGVALLSAIKLLERSGIQLKLTCCFFSSASRLNCDSGEVVVGTVLLKNYSDKLNLLKICFPLAHSSMVRRIGFKFLETVPGITDMAFRFGYGKTVHIGELRKIFQAENTVVLNYYTIADDMNFDTEKLIKYIEDNVKKQN